MLKVSEKKHKPFFASANSLWAKQFFCCFLQMLSAAATIEVSVLYLQGSVPCHVNLLAWTVFKNICFPFLLHKLTSISRRNWSCKEIPSSQNSDYSVLHFLCSGQWKHCFECMKVNFSKSLQNKITPFKHYEVFSYLQNHQLWDILVFYKSSYSETWQNTQFMIAILFFFIFTT